MKKGMIIFILLLTSYSVESQSITDTIFWENENPKEIYTISGKTMKLEGFAYKFFQDGTVSKIIEYRNGLKNGTSKEFFQAGNLKAETSYINDTLDGVKRTYYENKQIETIIKYTKGKLNGKFERFFRDGRISEAGYYIIGQLQNIIVDSMKIDFCEIPSLKAIRRDFDSPSLKVGLWCKFNKKGNVEEKESYSPYYDLVVKCIFNEELNDYFIDYYIRTFRDIK